MKDVTSLFDHYRMTARSVWNNGFWPDPVLRNWESLEQFRLVMRILFDSIVLAKLDLEWPLEETFRKPMLFFRIEPISEYGCPFLVDRPGDAITGGGVWNDPECRLSGASELGFIEFFDWDVLNCIDLHYYMAAIASFDSKPELVGRRALIERQYVKVLLDDATYVAEFARSAGMSAGAAS